MEIGVIVYASCQQDSKQLKPQTDEDWIELREKSKNSAQK